MQPGKSFTRSALSERSQCPVCLEIYTLPVTLPTCGHSFCRHCLQAIADTHVSISSDSEEEEEAKKAYLRCPTCRKSCVVPVASLPENFALSALCEELQNVSESDPIGHISSDHPSPTFVVPVETSPQCNKEAEESQKARKAEKNRKRRERRQRKKQQEGDSDKSSPSHPAPAPHTEPARPSSSSVPAPPAAAGMISNGSFVELQGLKKLTLNGALGEISGYVSDVGRYEVQLTAPTEAIRQYPRGIRVKPENILLVRDGPREAISFCNGELNLEPRPNSAWATGLSILNQYEWFIDCYRMRVDDDMVWGGGVLRGLYDTSNSGMQIVFDFLIFCKLAVANSVIPHEWSWSRCLFSKGYLLAYAFEKEDAKQKYGKESVFSGVVGSRSLRFTGEMVYGSSCMSFEGSETFNAMYHKLGVLMFGCCGDSEEEEQQEREREERREARREVRRLEKERRILEGEEDSEEDFDEDSESEEEKLEVKKYSHLVADVGGWQVWSRLEEIVNAERLKSLLRGKPEFAEILKELQTQV